MVGRVYGALSDPTRPVNFMNRMEFPVSAWKLSAIIIGKDRRVAIINEQSVSLGEVIYGNRVIAIHRNTVQLSNSDGTITLFLLNRSKLQEESFHKGIKYDVSM